MSNCASIHIAIVGAGVIGLTTALLLVDAGYRVTIVAKNLPGDFSSQWASPWAGALLAPHLDEGHQEIQEHSIKYWNLLLKKHPECGVREVAITEFYDDRKDDLTIWYRSLYPGMERIALQDLAPGTTVGFKYRGLVVDPNIFLPWISTALHRRGVQFIQKEISTLQELKESTGASLLINASGLGARELASDPKVQPVRGQTMFVACPDQYRKHLKEVFILQGSQYTYCIPRQPSEGIILGGVSQPGDTRTEIDPSLRRDILRRVNNITGGSFNWVKLDNDVVQDIVGFRPSRVGGLRVERTGQIIHAYGLGGLGYLFTWGVALKVKDLVQDLGNVAKL